MTDSILVGGQRLCRAGKLMDEGQAAEEACPCGISEEGVGGRTYCLDHPEGAAAQAGSAVAVDCPCCESKWLCSIVHCSLCDHLSVKARFRSFSCAHQTATIA